MNREDYRKILESLRLTPLADKTYISGEVVQRFLLKKEDLGEDLEVIVDKEGGREDIVNDLGVMGLIPKSPFTLNGYIEIELQGHKLKIRDSLGIIKVHSSIEKDYLWKGFTITSIYHSVGTGEILDPTGKGIEHLLDKVVRVVEGGIFNHNPQRILDAILLSVTRGFEITPMTLDYMDSESESLRLLTITWTDLEKILVSPDPVLGLKLWEKFDILYYSSIRRLREEVMAGISIVKSVSGKDRLTLWAAFLWKVYWKADNDFDFALNGLLFLREDKSDLKKILQFSSLSEPLSEERLREIQYILGERLYWKYIDLMEGLLGRTIDVREPKEMFTYKFPISGDDILRETGIKGKKVGEILEKLMKEAFKNPKITKEELVCLMSTYI